MSFTADYAADGSLDAGKVGRFVRFTGDGQVGLAVVSGSEIGVLNTWYGDGQCCVTHEGSAVVVAGESLSAGAQLTCNGEGKAVAGGSFALATASASSGQQVPCLVQTLPKQSQITLNTPKAADGKMFVIPNIFPQGLTLYITGAGDHVSNGRGAGSLFQIQSEQAEDAAVEWSFNDVVYMAGGTVFWQGGQAGDYANMECIAPATPVTPNGAGTGNCNVVSGLIIPAAGNGAFDVNLANGVPLPAVSDAGVASGQWDFTDPWTGSGTITPAAVPGQGSINLVAAQLLLARFVNKMPLLGDDSINLVIPAIKPKFTWPQWKLKVTLHNSGHAGLRLSWLLTTARMATV